MVLDLVSIYGFLLQNLYNDCQSCVENVIFEIHEKKKNTVGIIPARLA